jgi:parallel beta-helix repeat protein
MTGNGIYVEETSSPTVTGNTITNNQQYGISVDNGSSGTYQGNTISGNTAYGIYYSGNIVIDATNNYWGDSSGPLDDSPSDGWYNPLGQGDRVSDYVNYDPWLTGGLSIVPSKGGNAGQVTATIFGHDFVEGTTVKLVKDGQEIAGTNTSIINSRRMTTTFDLAGAGAPAGLYNLILTLHGNTQLTCDNCFTVEQGGEAKLWVDIVGRDRIRVGREQEYLILYGNSGNIDAKGVPLWIAFPKNVSYELNFVIAPPDTQPEGEELINWQEIPIHITTSNETLIPLVLPVVNAYSKVYLKIKITAPSNGDISLRTWLNPPLFHSPLSLDVIDCYAEMAKTVSNTTLNVLLPNQCINAMKDWWIDNTQTMLDKAYKKQALAVAYVHVLLGGLKAGVTCAAEIFPVSDAIMGLWDVVEGVETLAGVWDKCEGVLKESWRSVKPINVVGSIDPNDKSGPAGYGSEKFTTSDHSWGYMINFENIETATASAQEVTITDQLDITKLDIETFNFGTVSFGTHEITFPEGTKSFATTVDLRPEKNLFVNIKAELNNTTGLLTWHFKSIDPATGLPPEDPMVGFLPPNVTSPEGQGYVIFSIQPKNGLTTGTEIRNHASIVFDVNSPMDTPEVFNTIDSGIPTSSVTPLSAIQPAPDFTVSWSGSDDIGGSGIKNYDVYVSDNSGTYSLWITTAESSALFTGQSGHQYSFYSRARDNTGNIEDAPVDADTSTIVEVLTAFMGDINKDGIIDISDVILELRMALKLDPIQPCSDINNDGVVDISDVILTLRMALKIDPLQQCN